MRKGTFNDYYKIDIVEDLMTTDDSLYLKITYSEQDYPDFLEYINDKILKRTPITYKDENNEGEFYIINISLAKTNENLNIDFSKIRLNKEKYGDLIEKVSDEKKRSFVTSQYHGRIKMIRSDY